jgi:hypothetical protein
MTHNYGAAPGAHHDNGRGTMRHQAIRIELKSTTWLFASFILVTLVSSIGVAQINTWERKADMPTARVYHTASVVDGKIYVIGGFPSGVEVYDIATDTWQQGPEMPFARFAHSACVIDGMIYELSQRKLLYHRGNIWRSYS